MINQALRLARIVSSREGFAAALTWPKFSLTSFEIVTSLRRQGLQPRTIIDVGANEGQFGIAAAKVFPNSTVHSFEPVPECASRLLEVAKRAPNLRVHAIALGATEGTVQFHRNSDSRAGSVLSLGRSHRVMFPDAIERDTISVPVSTLDTALAHEPVLGPILLKIDVQGYERQVLTGASKILTTIDVVLLEMSFREMYEGELLFPEMLTLMESIGFRFARPIAWLTDNRSGEIVQVDGLFTRM